MQPRYASHFVIAGVLGLMLTGSGTFIRGSDETGQEGETRQGNVVVNCSG